MFIVALARSLRPALRPPAARGAVPHQPGALVCCCRTFSGRNADQKTAISQFMPKQRPGLPVPVITGAAPLAEDEIAHIREQSRLIFGNLPWSPCRTGNKVLRRKLVGPLFSPPNDKPFKDLMRTEFPTFLTEKEERRKIKLAFMRRRGKGPPKKGQGKRAMKQAGKKK